MRCLCLFQLANARIRNPASEPPCSVTLRQVHSADIQRADTLADRAAEGDALISGQIGLSIGVRSADCVPILLLDTGTHSVAAVHAGWRGSAGQIVERTVAQLAAQFGSDPNDIYAAIGPCIRPCCYQVSRNVAELFTTWFPDLEPEPDGKVMLDLAAANRKQLLSAGVSSDHILDSGFCTFCDSASFFSYRREPEDPGRMLSAIARIA